MVSADTAWSSGATGIAGDAETAARLRPMAKADAASIFMGFPFISICRDAAVTDIRKQCGSVVTIGPFTSNGGANDGGASGGDASPNDGGASPSDGDAIAGASDGPSVPVPV
jgi:hypothetical protein